jgi:hypothetical protein
MEEIKFDSKTFVWKTKLNLKKFKNDFLNDCYKKIELKKNNKNDAFDYKHHMKNKLNNSNKYEISNSTTILFKNKLDTIVQRALNICEYIYKNEGNDWNIINSDCWINRVRSLNPVQSFYYNKKRDDKFHTHTDISKKLNFFYPHYTWVYYIQMPNIIRKNKINRRVNL